MKRFLKWLFKANRQDIVFLQRMISIDHHIEHAVKEVSFDMLRDVKKRISYEKQYAHSLYEQIQIAELEAKAEKAFQRIRDTLIFESQCSFSFSLPS